MPWNFSGQKTIPKRDFRGSSKDHFQGSCFANVAGCINHPCFFFGGFFGVKNACTCMHHVTMKSVIRFFIYIYIFFCIVVNCVWLVICYFLLFDM